MRSAYQRTPLLHRRTKAGKQASEADEVSGQGEFCAQDAHQTQVMRARALESRCRRLPQSRVVAAQRLRQRG